MNLFIGFHRDRLMSRIARKNNDKEDRRRVLDIQREFQTKEYKVYDSTPDVKQIRNNSMFIINEGDNIYIGVRVGDVIKKVAVT